MPCYELQTNNTEEVNPCVANLDPGNVACGNNTCLFPSKDDWISESFVISSASDCLSNLQYWQICYDCMTDTSPIVGEYYSEYSSSNDYYDLYNDINHPQITKRYDVDGNEDIYCNDGMSLKILGTSIITSLLSLHRNSIV